MDPGGMGCRLHAAQVRDDGVERSTLGAWREEGERC
jgi:hypothetical protein